MNDNNQTNSKQSVLALLRSLVPDRNLSYYESLRIAELQAKLQDRLKES